MAAPTSYIKIPYTTSSGNDATLNGYISRKVNFIVENGQYLPVRDDEAKSEFEASPRTKNLYQKKSGKYILVNTYTQGITYYEQKGTKKVKCRACQATGKLMGKDSKEYTCPVCNGNKNIFITTDGVPIEGISVTATASGYTPTYKVSPPGGVGSISIRWANVIENISIYEEVEPIGS